MKRTYRYLYSVCPIAGLFVVAASTHTRLTNTDGGGGEGSSRFGIIASAEAPSYHRTRRKVNRLIFMGEA